MLNFKKITADNYNEIIPFLNKQEFCTCDYTELGLFMWVDFFCYEFAISNDVLYIRSNPQYNGQNVEYLLPLMGNNEKLSEGIALIIDHEKLKKRVRVNFSVIPEQYLPYFNSYKLFNVSRARDWDDYTYSVEKLVRLSGKKYSKKRNLIHQFLSQYPEYIYADIERTNIQEVVDFHKCNRAFADGSKLANYENNQVEYVLEHYGLFQLSGGILSVNNHIIAFCIGEIIKDCLYIHVEKANIKYKGAFQMMNLLYANAQYNAKKSIKTINREEDCGDEGLRCAKMSYYPDLINKYKVVLIINEN